MGSRMAGPQVLDASIRFGAVSGGSGDGYVTIEIEDDKSNISFVEIKLSYEEFGRAVGSNGSVDCKVEVRGLQYIGKKYQHKSGKAFLSEDEYNKLTKGVRYDSQRKALEAWITENCQEEGWLVSPYLGSQNSVEYGDKGSKILNFTYFRYVEEGEEVESV